MTSKSDSEALNFGSAGHLDHRLRYERALEFAEVVKGLWDSWSDDAFVHDRASTRFFDPAGLTVLNHNGKHFSVRGPLNVKRPPQGHPVLVQAGSSDEGRDLAARTAEVIFTAQTKLDAAKEFADDIHARLKAYRRSHAECRIMPGVMTVVGETREEALTKLQQLQGLIAPHTALVALATALGCPLRLLMEMDPDKPLPDALPPTNGPRSRREMVVAMARAEALSVRELSLRVASARGHWVLCGAASEIVDELEAWFKAGAVDGFNIMPTHLPGGFEDFVQHIVPELRKRGLFRDSYSGTTLREHLELARPSLKRVASGQS